MRLRITRQSAGRRLAAAQGASDVRKLGKLGQEGFQILRYWILTMTVRGRRFRYFGSSSFAPKQPLEDGDSCATTTDGLRLGTRCHVNRIRHLLPVRGRCGPAGNYPSGLAARDPYLIAQLRQVLRQPQRPERRRHRGRRKMIVLSQGFCDSRKGSFPDNASRS